MDSEVTLLGRPSIRLVYKRNDLRTAMLERDSVPYYVLTTSDDGVKDVRIMDTVYRKMVAEVHRKALLPDTFVLGGRNGGKSIKVDQVLKRGQSTSDGQTQMDMSTEKGAYCWRRGRGPHWALFAGSSQTPVAWTESVSGSRPTWMLVIEDQVSSIVDYIFASLFYLRGEPDNRKPEQIGGSADRSVWMMGMRSIPGTNDQGHTVEN